MYGLINNALKDMVLRESGQSGLDGVFTRAGLRSQTFVSSETYDDSITYRLIGAYSEESGIPVEDALRSFGQYWILETAVKHYGAMFSSAGSDFLSLMLALPRFHARVMLIYPALKPPNFRVDLKREGELELTYISERKGLTSFTIGLIEGLGIHFKVKTVVSLKTSSPEKGEHVFDVKWSSNE